jgi:uncharacterized protein YprB with RNaseH-like and TPR domain
MFAEPIKYKIQEEQFFLKFYNKEDQLLYFDTEEIGLYKSKVDYLLRNHYYRKEADLFLEKIKPTLASVPGVYKAEFLRSIDNDTTTIATLQIYETSQ